MTLELVFDFDGTITDTDTIASVVDAALSYHKSVSSPETCHSLTDAWRHIVKSYMTDLDSYHKSLDPVIHKNCPTPLDATRAQFSNDQRRQVERASLLRVQEAGLFRDLPFEHMFLSGQEHREKNIVKLRNGFSDFIDLIRSPSALETMSGVHILSVNWSASYIRGVLSREDIPSIIANDINPADGSINALPAISDDIAPGDGPGVLAVGSDKLSALRCLHRRQQKAKPKQSVEIVYFGDSTTDLECLLAFGGIVISPKAETAQRPDTKTTNPSKTTLNGSDLLHVLQTGLNYNVPHVSEYKDEPICWARDFAEIMGSGFLPKRAANTQSTKA